MYIKVHKKCNQWFRDDGTLVGKEIWNTDSHFNYNQHIIKTDDNRYVKAIFGYLDSNNFFIPLCLSYCDKDKCDMHNSEICLYCHSEDATAGYYIAFD